MIPFIRHDMFKFKIFDDSVCCEGFEKLSRDFQQRETANVLILCFHTCEAFKGKADVGKASSFHEAQS